MESITENHKCVYSEKPLFVLNIDSMLVCVECGEVFDSNVLKPEADAYMRTYSYNELNTKPDHYIGFKCERNNYHNFKIKNRESYVSRMINIGINTITRICSYFSVPNLYQKDIVKIFKKTWYQLKPCTAIRKPENLACVLVYLYSRTYDFGISIKDIAKISNLTVGKLFKYSEKVQKILKLKLKNRTNLIKRKIIEVCNNANFNIIIENYALELLKTTNKTTIPSIIAISLVYIALRNNNIKINVSKLIDLCNLKVSLSSILRYVKEYFGFNKKTKFFVFERNVWNNDGGLILNGN